eukprot:1001802-Alexandrium_andersonii.AAC.1
MTARMVPELWILHIARGGKTAPWWLARQASKGEAELKERQARSQKWRQRRKEERLRQQQA